MSPNLLDLNLTILEENQEVQISVISEDQLLIEFQRDYWILWPTARCWVDCDANSKQTGTMHYGSISAFYNKEILRLPGIPKNHQKKWTVEELQLLNTLIRADATVLHCSSILERTKWSVVSKLASEHGICLDHHMSNSNLGALTLNELLSGR